MLQAVGLSQRLSQQVDEGQRHVGGTSAACKYEPLGSLAAALRRSASAACEGKPTEALTAALAAARDYEAIEALAPALAARRRRCLQQLVS